MENEKYCPHCGCKIDDDSKFCGNCGFNLDFKNEVEIPNISKKDNAKTLRTRILASFYTVIAVILMLTPFCLGDFGVIQAIVYLSSNGYSVEWGLYVVDVIILFITFFNGILMLIRGVLSLIFKSRLKLKDLYYLIAVGAQLSNSIIVGHSDVAPFMWNMLMTVSILVYGILAYFYDLKDQNKKFSGFECVEFIAAMCTVLATIIFVDTSIDLKDYNYQFELGLRNYMYLDGTFPTFLLFDIYCISGIAVVLSVVLLLYQKRKACGFSLVLTSLILLVLIILFNVSDVTNVSKPFVHYTAPMILYLIAGILFLIYALVKKKNNENIE